MPAHRKPLAEGCTSHADCPVEGHVIKRPVQRGWAFTHIRLTPGQQRTLAERRRAAMREKAN